MPVTEDPGVIADELQLVVGALVRRMRAVSPEHDVTLSQISILKWLDREGQLTVAELARRNRITHQSVLAAVSGIASRGLVERTPDPNDGRQKPLAITDEGRRLLARRRQAGQEALTDAIAERLSAAERRHLSGTVPLLRRLLD